MWAPLIPAAISTGVAIFIWPPFFPYAARAYLTLSALLGLVLVLAPFLAASTLAEFPNAFWFGYSMIAYMISMLMAGVGLICFSRAVSIIRLRKM